MLCTASDTFSILTYSALFLSGICTRIQSYSELVTFTHRACSGLFKHIQYPVKPSHILNLAIFSSLPYLEPEASLKPCETLTRHIQNTATGHYSAIFRHIQSLAPRLHTQKPDIFRILEYSQTFLNCIPAHIQSPIISTKICKYSEL